MTTNANHSHMSVAETKPAGPKVLGLDLSLTATGIAGTWWAHTIKPRAQRTHELQVDYRMWRKRWLLEQIATFLDGVEFACIEQLTGGAGQDLDRQLAWLNWEVRALLWQRRVPYALVHPSWVKIYATGSGTTGGRARGGKQEEAKLPVMAAVSTWFPWFVGDDNAADALVLTCIAADHLGHPLVEIPADWRRRALGKVEWPPDRPAELPGLDLQEAAERGAAA